MRAFYLVLIASLLFACGSEDGSPHDLGNENTGGAGGSGGTGGTGGSGGIGGTEQPGPSSLSDEEVAHLEDMVGTFADEQGYPNLAIGVVKGGELVWHMGVGAGPGPAPDDTTRLRAGSITKIVTATALLQLAEEGTLSLDDTVATWVPEVEGVLTRNGTAVTLRHLLSHSSGIPRNGNGTVDWTVRNASITENDVLGMFTGMTLLFEPGTSYEYSNAGLALAGMVIARATDSTYRDVVQERILDPLGMVDSLWDEPRDNLAPGHHPATRGGYERAPFTWRMGAMEPAGGLFTSVRDLARLAAHGLGHADLLGEAMLAESQTPQVTAGGSTGFGLGWVVGESPEFGRLLWHDGSTWDYGAFLGILPDHDLGVIVLAGTGSHGDALELQKLGIATLAWLVDPETSILPEPVLTPDAIVETVGERVLGLLNDPTLEAIDQAIHQSFLAQVPAAQMLAQFNDIGGMAGSCSSFELDSDRGNEAFHLRFVCEERNLISILVAEQTPPHLLVGLGLLFE